MTGETTVEDVLDHYGVEIPHDIGVSAHSEFVDIPTQGPAEEVVLRETDGRVLGDRTIAICTSPEGSDALAHVYEAGELAVPEDGTYYGFPADVVQSVVVRLVEDTPFLVESLDEDYRPESWGDSDEESHASVSSPPIADGGDLTTGVLRTASPTTNRYDVTD